MPSSQAAPRGDAMRHVSRAGWRWFRFITTHSPSRFAISVFAALILVTTAVL